MPDLPSGNRIVLFTEIEGSTALRERNRQAMAVAAGQMGPWNQDFVQSYHGLHAALQSMMEILENAEGVTP